MCYSLSCLKISNTIRNNWKLQLHGGEGSKALTLSIIKHALPRVIARLYMKQVCVRSIEVPTKPCLHCWKACLIVLNTSRLLGTGQYRQIEEKLTLWQGEDVRELYLHWCCRWKKSAEISLCICVSIVSI